MTSWLDVLVAFIAAAAVIMSGYFGARAAGWLPGQRKPTSSPKPENASDPVIYALRQAEQAAIRAEEEKRRLNHLVNAKSVEAAALSEQLRDVKDDAQEWQSKYALAVVDRDEALAHAAQLQAEVARLRRRVSELTHPSSNRRTS